MPSEKLTQAERILRHLKKYGSITSLQSFREYGITRLSAIIYVLKKLNYEFDEELIKRRNRFGEKTTFKKYSLKK